MGLGLFESVVGENGVSRVEAAKRRQLRAMDVVWLSWLGVFVANTIELSVMGVLMQQMSRRMAAAMCYTGMWLKHPHLAIEEDTPPLQARSWWVNATGSLAITGSVVLFVLWLLTEPPVYLVTAKTVSVAVRYAWHIRTRTQTYGGASGGSFPWLLWLQMTALTITAYGLALGAYASSRVYPLGDVRAHGANAVDPNAYAGRFVVVAVVYPVARNLLKAAASLFLLGESAPNGHVRRSRGLYISILFDLPSYVVIYSQETTELVAALVACHAAVDLLFVLTQGWMPGAERLFRGWQPEHALWLQILATSMVVVIWPPLLGVKGETGAASRVHSLMLMERVFLSTCYSAVLSLLVPCLLAVVHPTAHRAPGAYTDVRRTGDVRNTSGLVDSLCYALLAIAIMTTDTQ